MSEPNDLIEKFRSARKSEHKVVLEGFHVIKHALRFNATLLSCITYDKKYVQYLALSLAPDLKEIFDAIETVEEKLFKELSPKPPESKIIAIAKKPRYFLSDVLKEKQKNPIVLLDDPSHPGNVGSVIRVAAAAGVHAVLVMGELDPWRPQVIRGAQGLHFALPVLHIESISNLHKPFIVFDERGKNLFKTKLPRESIFIFGSERRGVSKELKGKAEKIISIPMQKRVSSINLATSVGIALYATKL